MATKNYTRKGRDWREWCALIKVSNGPIGMAAGCPFCKHVAFISKPPLGHRGRGFGLSVSNILRGRIVRHIKESHPDAEGQ